MQLHRAYGLHRDLPIQTTNISIFLHTILMLSRLENLNKNEQ
jgi:hypothetical protein